MKPSKSGYILPLSLFLVIILMSGSIYSLYISKKTIEHSTLLIDKIETQIEAESELEKLKFYLATSRYFYNATENLIVPKNLNLPTKLYLDGREHNLSETHTLFLQDSAGLLNAMYPDPNTLTRLISLYHPEQKNNIIIDSLSDWFDEDDFHRIHGAEKEYYRAKNVPYFPRNARFSQSFHELKIIKGMDTLDTVLYKELERFHILSPSQKVNITTAPTEVLAAHLQISLNEAQRLTQMRSTNLESFIQTVNTITTYSPEMVEITPSKVIAIKIIVKRHNTQTVLRQIIDFSDKKESPYHTIMSD